MSGCVSLVTAAIACDTRTASIACAILDRMHYVQAWPDRDTKSVAPVVLSDGRASRLKPQAYENGTLYNYRYGLLGEDSHDTMSRFHCTAASPMDITHSLNTTSVRNIETCEVLYI